MLTSLGRAREVVRARDDCLSRSRRMDDLLNAPLAVVSRRPVRLRLKLGRELDGESLGDEFLQAKMQEVLRPPSIFAGVDLCLIRVEAALRYRRVVVAKVSQGHSISANGRL